VLFTAARQVVYTGFSVPRASLRTSCVVEKKTNVGAGLLLSQHAEANPMFREAGERRVLHTREGRIHAKSRMLSIQRSFIRHF
jgi:hypothetical protein